MSYALTKANINLYSILRNLEDLFELDDNINQLVKNLNQSVGFFVRGGPKGVLSFIDGKCSFTRGVGKCKIKLYFKSPEHFNQMIDGKANPIPLKGLTKIGFLTKDFMAMTDKLSYYLKPTDALLQDPTYLRINTIMSAYAAFYALAEIGNTDRIGKLNASRIPNGIINIEVKNGPSVHITVTNGTLVVEKGIVDKPRSSMTFADVETANAVLNGKADTYSCVATEKIKMKGFIPMLDNMNKLLGQIPSFLK